MPPPQWTGPTTLLQRNQQMNKQNPVNHVKWILIAHVYGIKSVKLVILKVLTWLAHMSESWMTIAKLIKQKGH